MRSGLLLLATWVWACAPAVDHPVTEDLAIDRLLSEQAEQLARQPVRLHKSASVSLHESDTTYTLSASEWKTELEVFETLGLVNQTLYRDTYRITDPVDDPRSNLLIRQYLHDEAPLRSLQVFYQQTRDHVRRMEGTVLEVTPLYTTRRELMLKFEDANGRPLLTGYSVTGFQKLALRDTVWFMIQGEVIW